ncbi:MAG: phytanoyl-CoA dioxygenase family protein [Thaumarchaeota archaeon]|nr:phytanoyl-CoA dioxygenase family protein [Nitrososphaerota archaeon]
MQRLAVEQRRKKFEKDGFIVVEDLLTPTELRGLKRRVAQIGNGKLKHVPEDRFEVEPAVASGKVKAKSGIESLRKINNLTDYDEVFLATAKNPKILDVVEELLGPNIMVFGDQFFVKPAKIGVEKPYHQDHAYFFVEPKNIVTCWIALEDATVENGCLHFIPGSHRVGLIDHSEKWMVGDREDMQVPESAIDLSKEVAAPLKSGSASFHHSMILHKSGPNKSPHPRWGWAISYMSSDSTWAGPPGKKPKYRLVRGKAFRGKV